MKATEAQSDFVERVGRWWESVSGSRTAGRILGWLMICEPAHQSSQALAETLQASTGSVSMQTRQLEQIGLVETITFPGDRATYFHLRPHVWAQVLSTEHLRIKTMNELAIAGLEVLPTERPDRVTELKQMSEFLIDEWPSLLERLETYVEEKQL